MCDLQNRADPICGFGGRLLLGVTRPASFPPFASRFECAPHNRAPCRHATGLHPTRPRAWPRHPGSWRSRLPFTLTTPLQSFGHCCPPAMGVARRRFGFFPSLNRTKDFPCVRVLLLCFHYCLRPHLYRPPSRPGRTPTTATDTRVTRKPVTGTPATGIPEILRYLHNVPDVRRPQPARPDSKPLRQRRTRLDLPSGRSHRRHQDTVEACFRPGHRFPRTG